MFRLPQNGSLRCTESSRKMIMYNISSKMNSTFATIGKATSDKLNETVDGKSSNFRID